MRFCGRVKMTWRLGEGCFSWADQKLLGWSSPRAPSRGPCRLPARPHDTPTPTNVRSSKAAPTMSLPCAQNAPAAAARGGGTPVSVQDPAPPSRWRARHPRARAAASPCPKRSVGNSRRVGRPHPANRVAPSVTRTSQKTLSRIGIRAALSEDSPSTISASSRRTGAHASGRAVREARAAPIDFSAAMARFSSMASRRQESRLARDC